MNNSSIQKKFLKGEYSVPSSKKFRTEYGTVWFPQWFNQTAVDITVSKYFKRDNNNELLEVRLSDVVLRMAETWFPDDERKRDATMFLLLNQVFAPNSPQWFNTGVNVLTEQDGYYFNGERVKEEDKKYNLSACYITGLEDSLLGDNSITDTVVNNTKLFKYGSGVGFDVSTLRPKGSTISKGGTSSGVLSFLELFDTTAGIIKSGGTTRRAANMITINAEHKDALSIIQCKSKEEAKARLLLEHGYTYQEAQESVKFQNMNISVKLTDEFMECYMNENNYLVVDEFTGENRIIDTKEIMSAITKSAWLCGDPGIQFTSNINKKNIVPSAGTINSSNPCSEFLFLDNSACNLASINLLKCYDEKEDKVNYHFLHEVSKLVTEILDRSIDIAGLPTKEISENTIKHRPLGLGYANLAALGIKMGYGYGTKEFLSMTSCVTAVMTLGAYNQSKYLATDETSAGQLNHIKFLSDMKSTVENLVKNRDFDTILSKQLIDTINTLTERNGDLVYKYDFRNAQLTLIAPTGTISCFMDCDTFACEPMYSLVYEKATVDDKVIKYVNPILKEELLNILGNEEDVMKVVLGDLSILHEKYHHLLASVDGPVKLNYRDHINVMAAIQPFIHGGISKTVNVPSDFTEVEIEDLIVYAWENDIKAITVYRNGSKIYQPITVSNKEDEEISGVKEDNKTNNKTVKERCIPTRNKPDGLRNARVHCVGINNENYYITVSKDKEGNIVELYVGGGKQGSFVRGVLDSLSKEISIMLQYNIPVEAISKSLRGSNYEPNGFVYGHPNIKSVQSFSDMISKILDIETGNYKYCQVKPETYETEKEQEPAVEIDKKQPFILGEVCTECGRENTLRQNGTCKICTSCGTTTGCS